MKAPARQLAAETTYFVVIEWLNPSGTDAFALIPQTYPTEETAATEEDPGGAEGWSIADQSYYLTVSSDARTWAAYDETASFKIQVKEAAATAAKANSPATGLPTVSGTAQVGQTLTAGTSAIDDADGLTNVTFEYQWVRSDNGADTDIAGAADSAYTVVLADQAKTIKVRVTFDDDRGHSEILTSEATEAAAAAPVPLTVSVTVSAPAAHDGSSEFTFDIEFSEEFGLSYVTLKLHAFNVTGGSVEKAQRKKQAQQHLLADNRCTGLHRGRRSDRTAGNHGLRRPGSHLHRRRQEAVQLAELHRIRTGPVGARRSPRPERRRWPTAAASTRVKTPAAATPPRSPTRGRRSSGCAARHGATAEGTADGQAEQHLLAHYGAAHLHRGRSDRTPGYHGLQCRGSHLHRRRQEIVQLAQLDRIRAWIRPGGWERWAADSTTGRINGWPGGAVSPPGHSHYAAAAETAAPRASRTCCAHRHTSSSPSIRVITAVEMVTAIRGGENCGHVPNSDRCEMCTERP